MELKLADGKKGYCDPNIHDLCQALNDGGIKTRASCGGHNGKYPANICLDDGRVLLITTYKKAQKLFVKEDK